LPHSLYLTPLLTTEYLSFLAVAYGCTFHTRGRSTCVGKEHACAAFLRAFNFFTGATGCCTLVLCDGLCIQRSLLFSCGYTISRIRLVPDHLLNGLGSSTVVELSLFLAGKTPNALRCCSPLTVVPVIAAADGAAGREKAAGWLQAFDMLRRRTFPLVRRWPLTTPRHCCSRGGFTRSLLRLHLYTWSRATPTRCAFHAAHRFTVSRFAMPTGGGTRTELRTPTSLPLRLRTCLLPFCYRPCCHFLTALGHGFGSLLQRDDLWMPACRLPICCALTKTFCTFSRLFPALPHL